jgi:hypothetical protein
MYHYQNEGLSATPSRLGRAQDESPLRVTAGVALRFAGEYKKSEVQVVARVPGALQPGATGISNDSQGSQSR